MITTQAAIVTWADRTFGPSTDMRRLVARANEEMSELIRLITSPEPDPDKIAEECADIAIALCRCAAPVNYDMTEVFQLDVLTGGIYSSAVKANGLLAFLLERLDVRNVERPENIGRLIGNIIIKMAEICRSVGRCLSDAIDRKMAINYARHWRTDGTGHGYHVEPGATA